MVEALQQQLRGQDALILKWQRQKWLLTKAIQVVLRCTVQQHQIRQTTACINLL